MRERIDLAFHIMDREYGVTRLLDPEGENGPACYRPVTDQTAGISLLNQCFLCRLAGTMLFVLAVHAVYRGWAVPSRPAPSKQTRKKIADINIANHPNRKTKSVDSPIYIKYEDTDNQPTHHPPPPPAAGQLCGVAAGWRCGAPLPAPSIQCGAVADLSWAGVHCTPGPGRGTAALQGEGGALQPRPLQSPPCSTTLY